MAPWAPRVISVGSRIDQELQASDRKRKREGVGMPVGGDSLVAHRPCIGDQADFTVCLEFAAEDVVATRRKCLLRPRPRSRSPSRLKQGIGPVAQEPTSLVVQGARLEAEIVSLKQDRPGREQ